MGAQGLNLDPQGGSCQLFLSFFKKYLFNFAHAKHSSIIFFSLATWHVGSSFPDQGLNQQPLHWEGGVLTTEPGKSPLSALSNAGLGFCLTPPRSPLAGTEMWAWPSCLGPVASLNHGLSPGASEALLTRTDRRRVLEGRAVSHSGSVWARPPDVTPCMSRGPPTCVSLP